MNKNDILQLPVVDKRNKIISIISSKDLSLSRQVKNPVLIMAVVLVKIVPLTKVIPKPLLKIRNDRILDKIIENIRYNFKKIYISVYYLSQKITEHAQIRKLGFKSKLYKRKKTFRNCWLFILLKE